MGGRNRFSLDKSAVFFLLFRGIFLKSAGSVIAHLRITNSSSSDAYPCTAPINKPRPAPPERNFLYRHRRTDESIRVMRPAFFMGPAGACGGGAIARWVAHPGFACVVFLLPGKNVRVNFGTTLSGCSYVWVLFTEENRFRASGRSDKLGGVILRGVPPHDCSGMAGALTGSRAQFYSLQFHFAPPQRATGVALLVIVIILHTGKRPGVN